MINSADTFFTAFFDHIYKGADIFGHDCIRKIK